MSQNKWFKPVLAIGGAILLVLILVVSPYNSLVNSEVKVDQTVADLEVQLQRRFDLIPNLVSAVKGAMTQEQKIIGQVTEARTKYAGATTSDNKIAAANQLEGALARLLVIVENYPQVASLQNVRDLQVQLEGTENRVAQARRSYNEAATSFNGAVRRFPRSIIASVFGFDKRVLFTATPGAETAPTVDLGNGK